MTVRVTVSLPDDIHTTLKRLAGASNISEAAVVRAVLSETLPRLTSVLDYLGTVTPAEAAEKVGQVDAWAKDLRELLHDAPEGFESFRTVLDEPEETGTGS